MVISANRHAPDEDRDPPQTAPNRWRRWMWWVGVVVAAVLVFGALRLAAPVLLPITVSVFLVMLLWPLHRRLSRWVGQAISAAANALLVVIALGVIGLSVWWGASLAASEFAKSDTSYRQRYAEGRQWLVEQGVPAEWLPRAEGDGASIAAEWFDALPQRWQQTMQSLLTGGLRTGLALMGGLLLSVFLTMLLLVEGPRWGERLERIAGAEAAERARGAWTRSATQVQRFMLVKSAGGVVSGVATWLWLWAIGVPLAPLWGFLTFLLNYIPNIGAYIAGAPPTLLALLEGGIGHALIVVAGLFVIESAVSNLLEPLLYGGAMRLSPYVMLVSLIFWWWMWGLAGAFLSVPLTAMFVAVLQHVPRVDEVGNMLEDPEAWASAREGFGRLRKRLGVGS